MDHDPDDQLDQILERTRASALKSLNAVVDVDRHLRDLHAEAEPHPVPARRPNDSGETSPGPALE